MAHDNYIKKRKIQKKQNIYLLLLYYGLFLNFIKIALITSSTIFESEINMVIQGSGTINIIYSYFQGQPSKVLVNGVEDTTCSKTCTLGGDLTNITLLFEDKFETCEQMFMGLQIKEIDLSKFDTSEVTSMRNMFRSCLKLEKINFGNINTSSLQNLEYTFSECSELVTIYISNIDTSQVTSMKYMFEKCSKIQYLDLSNFNTLKVSSLMDMFSMCTEIKYLNLYSFKINSSVDFYNIFFGIPNNATYCINDEETKNYLLGNDKYSNCSEEFFNTKYSDTCLNNKYQYIYLNICYTECPNGTYELNCEANECDSSNKKECFNATPSGYYLDINEKKFKKCYVNCLSCTQKGNIMINNCKECLDDYIFSNGNCYEKCDYYYYFDEKEIYNCTVGASCPQPYNKLIVEKKKCIDNCQKDDVYKYEYNYYCYDKCPDGTLVLQNNYTCYYKNENSNIIKEILDKEVSDLKNNINISNIEIQNNILQKIKDIINIGFNLTSISEGNDFTYVYDNVAYTITTTSNQKNSSINNLSTINLGKCEKKLKDEYNISKNNSLYILKIDALIDNINKVEYDVFYPFYTNNYTILNKSICKDIKIDILVPINIATNEIDKYNSSSGYYNDICYTLKTKSGTDESLKDRRNDYIKDNLPICEENCDFSKYDTNTKKAICSCYTKINLPLISEIKVDKKKLISNFKDINNIGNIKVLKCYHLLFDKNNIFKNSANYLISIILIINIISNIVFCYSDKAKIKNYIYKFSKYNQNCKYINNKADIKSSPIKQKKNNDIRKKRVSSKKLKNRPSKLNLYKTSVNNNIIINYNKNQINSRKKKLSKISGNNSNLNSQFKLQAFNPKGPKSNKKIKSIYNNSYNDYELNFLKYEEAKIIDNRNYWKYYISLIKTKHILFFSFLYSGDYNSRAIKIYIFFFTFTINYFVSAIFYSDSTMHEIYVSQGAFNFAYQIPKMFYSLIISSLLKLILNLFGLCEKSIISYRNDDKKELNPEKVFNRVKCKIIIFYIITYILIPFFWIYLGCFCAVYKNTQKHLLKEVISSFCLSFITPIIINLFPGFFRISSLNKGVNKPFLYKISQIIQMF